MTTLNENQAHEAATIMMTIGGQFASSIGEAYRVADSHNKQKLLDAFGYLFESHLKIGVQ